VFRLGLLQEGDVGVSVFPEREEILICGMGLGGVALHDIGAGEAEVRQGIQWGVSRDAAIAESLLKLYCGLAALALAR
jgi:hypothetical protein